MMGFSSKLGPYCNQSIFSSIKDCLNEYPLAYTATTAMSAACAVAAKVTFSSFAEIWSQQTESQEIASSRSWALLGSATAAVVTSYLSIACTAVMAQDVASRSRNKQRRMPELEKKLLPVATDIENIHKELLLQLKISRQLNDSVTALILSAQMDSMKGAFVKWADCWKERIIDRGLSWEDNETKILKQDLDKKMDAAKMKITEACKKQVRSEPSRMITRRHSL